MKITHILPFCTLLLLLTPSKGYGQKTMPAVEKQIISQVERHTNEALSVVEKQIIGQVERHTDEALSFLEGITNINSGTMNHEGVRAVGSLFMAELAALGFETRWISMPDSVNRAGHLFAYRQGSQGKRLLLLGHLDTVFEPNSPFQHFERREKVVAGPGVNDMKGGNVLMLLALKALHATGALDGTRITVALMGDEENPGLPLSISRRDLINTARDSDIALGFEVATGLNLATVARRGMREWKLRVQGQQGHSSGIFGERAGSGAIFEAARILNAFYEDVRGEQYLTFNPGIILGGTQVDYDPKLSRGTAFGKTNVIAQTVTVEGGLRFISEEQKERAQAKMREIVAQNLPGTSAEITFSSNETPAMEPSEGNYALLAVLDQVSQDLGYGRVEAFDPGRRGAADISFVAGYVSALDGLGVSGRGAHSPEEVMDLQTFPLLTKRAALLLYRLTRQQ